MQTLLAFIIVFGTIVIIHELGHFVFAKRAGILVREFAIGFGPKLFSHKKGETLYSVRVLPLGGYVRMAGEDPEISDVKTGKEVALRQNERGEVTHILLNPELAGGNAARGRVMDIDLERDLYVLLADEDGGETRYAVAREAVVVTERGAMQIAPLDRQFSAKSVGARALTLFGGPLFNIVLAVILFIAYFAIVGVPDYVKFGEISKDSPAAAAGLKTGDRVLAVDDKKVESGADFTTFIQERGGEAISLKLERNGQAFTTNVTPKYEEEHEKYIIGVIPEEVNKPADVVTAFKMGFVHPYNMTLAIFDGFRIMLTGQAQLNDLTGPVGIANFTGKIAATGFANSLQWTGFLSLYLGIFNLLPVPALDGSRLLFVGIEAVRGKPIDPQKEGMVHLIGFALLMMLMLVVTYNDIMRLIS
ncbi:RIP metalloprotease RseP [Numidum massiliense]|uniref:RIP metalloprotease RseP n=1 Tax=Numidum massiliense TaxID=1522315 RepID=UPI0006D5405F|nr:RIP metalloprotease RseP [Numidum massiliense]